MSITWSAEKRNISDLIPAEYNPRQMTEKQAENLEKSLSKFDLAAPIIINQNNTVIGGHQRINILKRAGKLEVDVRVPDRQLSEEEEKELNLRLNKNLGEWDFDGLMNMDGNLLKDVGFEDWELESIGQTDLSEDENGGLKIKRSIECPHCGADIHLKERTYNAKT